MATTFLRKAIIVARRAAPIVMVIGVAGLAWLTVRGTAEGEPFPDALLQTEGAVLAALVFVLGLNQAAVQRGFDELVARGHDSEDKTMAACVADDTPGAAIRTWASANRDWWVVVSKSGESLLADARDTREIEKYTDDSWAWERLGWGGRLSHLLEELKSDKDMSPRRRSRREREVATLRHRSDASYARAKELGKLAAGMRRRYGKALVIVARAHRLDRLLGWFTYLLVACLLVGLIRGGPDAASWADPGVWAAVALPVIASIYRAVVAAQLRSEATTLVNELKDSWLVHLTQAELGLGAMCEKLTKVVAAQGVPEVEKEDAEAIRLHLDLAEAVAPEVPWLASLRGRLHLLHATTALARLTTHQRLGRTSARREADVSREQATAEPLLRRAYRHGDDPVAGLALARCLELCLQDEDGPRCAGDALDLLERLRPHMFDFGSEASGVKLAHEWTWAQRFLLRPEDADLAGRFDRVVDHLSSDDLKSA